MKLKRNQCIIGCFTAKELNASEKAAWFQTTPPYGEYPAGNMTDEHGKPVKDAVVVFDEESVRKTVEAFRAEMQNAEWPGVLVDREHFSLDLDKPSDAMAWAKDIRIAEDGAIWTRWEFTPKGRELYETKTLINRSPVLRLERREGGKFSPCYLESIGMTNTPHFKELSPLAAAKAAAEDNHQKGTTDMDPEILAALGLAEGAQKEDVLAAIKVLKDQEAAAVAKATDAEKKAEEAETACRGLKADAFISANKDKIVDVAKFREAYLKDPQGTETAFGLFRFGGQTASKPPTTRIVARDAQPPKTPAAGAAEGKMAARAAAVNNYLAAHKNATHAEAWTACRMADPETFAD